MPTNNPKGRPKSTNDTTRTLARRMVLEEHLKFTAEISTRLKSIDAKLTVLISKVHNLGVDSSQSATRSTQLVQVLAELLEADAPSQGEALAVVKDFLFNVTRKKKV
jgi:hypothetical protein